MQERAAVWRRGPGSELQRLSHIPGGSDKSFYFPRPYLQLCKMNRCPPVSHPGLQFQDPSRKPHKLQSKLTRGHSAAFQPDLCLWPWLDFFTYLCLGFSIGKAIRTFLLTGESAVILVKAYQRKFGVKRIWDLMWLWCLRGYRYEAKLALPNGTSWIGICAPHERYHADVVLAHKARLCKRSAEEYQIPGKARGGVSPF